MQESMPGLKNFPTFPGDDKGDHLKKINLKAALSQKNTDNFFIQSGLSRIFEATKENLDGKAIIKHLFIENSTFSSAIGTNTLDAFTCIYSNNEHNSEKFRENIYTYFKPIISSLQRTDQVLLWHPEFCRKSTDSMASFSSVNCKNNKSIFSLVTDKLSNLINEVVSDAETLSEIEFTKFCFKEDVVYAGTSGIPFKYSDFIGKSEIIGKHNSAEHLQLLNHALYDNFFLPNKELKNNEHSILLSIPVLSSPGELDDQQDMYFKGHGAIFIYLILEDLKEDFVAFGEMMDNQENPFAKLSIELPRLIKTITFDYIFSKGIELANRSRDEATQAAKAAIMARNMSHNIGSHVLFNIQKKLKDIETLIQYGVLKNVINEENGKLSLFSTELQDIKNKVEMPFLQGLGYFINYLQERQDFIATIATSFIPPFNSVNFKDTVLDGFAWDSRNIRHKAKLKGNINRGTETNEGKEYNNLLLDNIIQSEQFRRSDISIYFNERNLNEIDVSTADTSWRNIEVNLPGGVMGRQALFSIFENFLRNSAKHLKQGNEMNGQNKIFNFRVFMFDNVEDMNSSFQFYSEKNNPFILKENSDQYYSLVLSDDFDMDMETLEKILENMSTIFVDDSGDLNNQNKGLKEMRISAAWLRRVTILEEKQLLKQELPLVCAGLRKVGNKQHLAYHFFIPKSVQVVVISDKFNSISKDKKRELSLIGWQFVSDRNEALIVSSKITLIDPAIKKTIVGKMTRTFYLSAFDLEKLIEIINTSEVIQGDKLNVLFEEYYALIINRNLGINTAKDNILIVSNDMSTNFPEMEDESLGNIRLALSKADYTENIEMFKKGRVIYYKSHWHNNAQYNQFANEFYIHSESRAWSPYFDKFEIKPEFENLIYIESITGDNSTSRLLRFEELNTSWKLKMVESALTKILIIDERIWQEKTAIDYCDNTVQELYNKIIQMIRVKQPHVDIVDDIVTIIEEAGFYVNSSAVENKILGIEDKDLLAKIIEGLLPNNFIRPDKLIDTDILQKRNIYLANIEFSKNGFIDLIDSMGSLYYSIKSKTESDSLNWIETKNHNMNYDFHFITIHQGLIDKITSHLKVSTYEVLRHFETQFSNARIMVHSGRSKPDASILPEEYPFINFSVLNSLLHDSKYTFTEQFYGALNFIG